MSQRYHPGELSVQARAGVREQAARIAGSIHDAIPAAAQAFLEERRWVVIAAAGADGRPWASLLAGPPGFVRAIGPDAVRLEAHPFPGDPLAGILGETAFAGLLAIDLATRRRMRLNGRLEAEPGGGIVIQADQVYANCPRYIQRRAGTGGTASVEPRLVGRSATLTEAQREWIRRADTFFIATANPGEGADASHRGGPPGFVSVAGDRLIWPDYAGNLMYNTLGNIAAHPRAGLLIPDFDSGGLLQVTGRAGIEWDPARAAAVPGAERLVELTVEEAVEIAGALGGG